MKRLKKIERKYVTALRQLRKVPVRQLRKYKSHSRNFKYHINEIIRSK